MDKKKKKLTQAQIDGRNAYEMASLQKRKVPKRKQSEFRNMISMTRYHNMMMGNDKGRKNKYISDDLEKATFKKAQVGPKRNMSYKKPKRKK